MTPSSLSVLWNTGTIIVIGSQMDRCSLGGEKNVVGAVCRVALVEASAILNTMAGEDSCADLKPYFGEYGKL